MATVVVIGGGASGLASAYYLSKLAAVSSLRKVILLEGSSRLGGWVHTTRHADGTIYEHGPRSIRVAGPSGKNTLELVEELGLEKEVIPVLSTHPAATNRYVYVNKGLHVLPRGIGGIVRKMPPFSKSLARQSWREPFVKPGKEEDESVYNFIKRRLSTELAEFGIDPFCRGVFAGNARELSARSCLGPLFRYEQKYGSIVKGVFKSPKEKLDGQDCDLVKRFRLERWSIWSLSQGLQQLAEGMVTKTMASPLVEVRTDTQVKSIVFRDGKAKVTTNQETIDADHVISSIYAGDLSKLISEEQKLSDALARIPSVTVPVVNLEYDGKVLPVQGFGHLIPSSEPSNVLGVIYESSIFSEHDNKEKDTTRLTCMMGGAWYKELFGEEGQKTSEDFITLAIEAIREQLGIKAEPMRVQCSIQKNCIPQYLVGHWKILETIDNSIADKKLPLSVVGASYKGPSVNDCIYNARLNVENVISSLKS